MALANLKYDETVKESKDTVSGSYQVRPSGVYPATVKVAYLGKSRNGADSLNLIFDIDGTEHRETLWLTNREGRNFYTDKEGEKHYLAGFQHADALHLVTTGFPIGDANTEDKVIKIYNPEQKQEVPTQVPCLTAMHGKQVLLGILQERTFKTERQQDGSYKEIVETRDNNVIDKVFHFESSKTVNELKAKTEKAEFIDTWKTKWTDQIKDKTKGKTPNGTGATAGAPKAAQARPTSSLFASA